MDDRGRPSPHRLLGAGLGELFPREQLGRKIFYRGEEVGIETGFIDESLSAGCEYVRKE